MSIHITPCIKSGCESKSHRFVYYMQIYLMSKLFLNFIHQLNFVTSGYTLLGVSLVCQKAYFKQLMPMRLQLMPMRIR